MKKYVITIVGTLVTTVAAAVLLVGWLRPDVFGLGEEDRNSQIIVAVERTKEVALVSLAVQGIDEQRRDREVFGQSIPGTGQASYLQYEFKAKLGLDGSRVKIDVAQPGSVAITIPAFEFIGYDDPTFKTVVEDNGVLSFVTPDIDQVEMINRILGDDDRAEYLNRNNDVLRSQAEAFYRGIVAAVDPTASVEFTFE